MNVPRNQINTALTTDGAGGAIVTWMDSRNSSGLPHSFDIYAQRVDASGTPLWAANGLPVCILAGGDSNPAIISDGAGGAIIAWTRTTGVPGLYWDIFIQRIDAAGNPLWPVNGVQMNTQGGFQSNARLVSDGAGGAIVAWFDNYEIYARRITATGQSPWTPSAIPVAASDGAQAGANLVSDGVGGAIIAWSDTTGASDYDIYAQRVTSAGVPAWTSAGLAICTANAAQLEPMVVDDGAGGAVVMWRDYRAYATTSADIFMQRVNGAGVVKWGADGIPLCNAPGFQGGPVGTRFGGHFIATWGDSRNGDGDVYAQRFDTGGVTSWALNGVPLCTAPGNQAYAATVAGDGSGGAYVAWPDYRGPDFDVYAQHVNALGNTLWHPDGEVVVSAPWTQTNSVMVSDGTDGAIIGWSDSRNGVDPDIYVHHLGPHGPTITRVSQTPSPAPLLIRPNFPNPFSESSRLEFHLSNESTVTLELFDINGRRIRGDELRARPAGWNHVDVVARDQWGHALPSGVYFLRISAAEGSATRKIVIAR